MRKFLLPIILLLIFSLSGCNSDEPKKVTAVLLTKALTTATLQVLDCEEEEIIKTQVGTQMYKWFKIEQEKGVVQDLCKTAITSVVPQLIGATVPSEWKCKITKLEDASQVLAEYACNTLK